jgi:hypothetical protein
MLKQYNNLTCYPSSCTHFIKLRKSARAINKNSTAYISIKEISRKTLTYSSINKSAFTFLKFVKGIKNDQSA